MESINKQKGILVKDIEDMKSGQLEQMYLTTFYGLSAYFKSLVSFGSGSFVTKDSLLVIKEMLEILKTERKLFNFILKNIDNFQIDAVSDVIATIDELNDKTIEYYYNVLEDIEEACEMKEEHRGIRPRKEFATLLQTESYTNQVVALAESKDCIKAFLGFEEKFWNFIKNKDSSNIRFSPEVVDNISYVTPIFNENGIIVDFKMFVPAVINLYTALNAIKCYERAYNIYKSIGRPFKKEFDSSSEELQESYKAFLHEKAKSLFKLKV